MNLTKQNYVLVDFENVQSIDLERIKSMPVKVVIFAGQNQKSVSMELFRKVCAMPGVVEVVEGVGSGKNALDFQMACYAGRIAEREPEAFVHFVSKDKGFDIVVQYLKSEKRFSSRVDSFSSLLFLAPSDEYKRFTLPQKVEHVIGRLQRCSATRPRKLKTLQSSMNAMFSKQLDEPAIKEVLDHLISSRKVVEGANGTVTYAL
ncbi:MAG TPA: PIN domain-containing protein [Clostridia bacterium]|nr:PIN domain-containing protein [Clostridia bacterium]